MLVCGGPHPVDACHPLHEQFAVLALLGSQVRVAEAWEVELVEAGRGEAGAIGTAGAPGVGELVGVGQGARRGAAELRVAVAAQAGLHVVRSHVRGPTQRQRVDAALAHGERRSRAADVLLDALEHRQGLAQRQRHAVLPGELGLLRLDGTQRGEGAGRSQGVVHIQRAAQGHLRSPAFQHLATDLHRLHAVAQARARVSTGPVVDLGCALGIEPKAFNTPARRESPAGAHAARVLPEAVVVGIEIAELRRRVGGRKAAGLLVLSLGGQIEVFGAEAHPSRGQSVVPASGTEACITSQPRLPSAREDLHDTAHRIAAVQRGHRSPHDLDALDGVERQVVERGRVQRGRADAHAVDQQQHMTRFQAAHEER